MACLKVKVSTLNSIYIFFERVKRLLIIGLFEINIKKMPSVIDL